MGPAGAASGSHPVAGMAVMHGGMNMVPQWLVLLWTCALLAVVGSHCRYLLESGGERRLWNARHMVLGVGMIFMFAPPSIDHLNIPAALWQLVLANAAAAVLAAILTRSLEGQSTNVLWLISALELGAMVYMWLGQTLGVLSWTPVGYFLAVSIFWALGGDHLVDGRWWIRPAPTGGTVAVIGRGGGAAEIGPGGGAAEVAAPSASGALACGLAAMVLAR